MNAIPLDIDELVSILRDRIPNDKPSIFAVAGKTSLGVQHLRDLKIGYRNPSVKTMRALIPVLMPDFALTQTVAA